MKYCIDKIEDNIVLLENINTGEKLEINISELSFNVKEGMIIQKTDQGYEQDEQTEKDRRASILAKFNKLKKK